MSLEAQMEALNNNVIALTAKIGEMLTQANAVAGTAPAAEAPKTTSTKKTATKAEAPKEEAKAEVKEDTAPAITLKELDERFRPWLGEFEKDHPESVARRAVFKENLTKLGVGKMSEMTDVTKMGKLAKWFDTKAKAWDEGHGIGRFAADPAPAAEEEAEDDDL